MVVYLPSKSTTGRNTPVVLLSVRYLPIPRFMCAAGKLLFILTALLSKILADFKSPSS